MSCLFENKFEVVNKIFIQPLTKIRGKKKDNSNNLYHQVVNQLI
jgi:hypothetical protein